MWLVRKVFCSQGQFEKSPGYTYQPIGDEPLLILLETINDSDVKVAEMWESKPGRVAQWLSVTCLTTDACPTADPGVAFSIPAWSSTFKEIDLEIISTVILLPSSDLFKKGCCQLQAKVCVRSTG